MYKKMIIVEGKNDLIFLKWLLDRFAIVYEEILLRHIGGKTNIENVLKSCAAGSDYSENGITIKFSDYEIEQLLIVKDFDINDNVDEISQYRSFLSMSSLTNNPILKDVLYICGDDSPPKILESLFFRLSDTRNCSLTNLLTDFSVVMDGFQESRSPDKLKFGKYNDKNKFESFLKLHYGRIEYTVDALDDLLGSSVRDDSDIQKLIDKIQRFIEE